MEVIINNEEAIKEERNRKIKEFEVAGWAAYIGVCFALIVVRVAAWLAGADVGLW